MRIEDRLSIAYTTVLYTGAAFLAPNIREFTSTNPNPNMAAGADSTRKTPAGMQDTQQETPLSQIEYFRCLNCWFYGSRFVTEDVVAAPQV
jgi:hypothetical protein